MLSASKYRQLARAARRAGRRLLMASMATILVLGVLRAGSRYFYCGAMETVFEAPCCSGSHHRGDAAQIQERTDDCCKRHTLGTLPAAAIPVVAPIPPPPLVAALQLVPVQLPLLAPRPSVSRGAQTGPPLQGAPNDRSRLMVYLI